MTESQPSIDAHDLAARWIELVRRETGSVTIPHGLPGVHRREPVRETLARARAALLPPIEGLCLSLSQSLAGWTIEWTDQLVRHPKWANAKRNLQQAFQQLDARRMNDAELEIENLLADCCPPVETALCDMTPALRGVGTVQPPPEQRREALLRLIDWLDSLTGEIEAEGE